MFVLKIIQVSVIGLMSFEQLYESFPMVMKYLPGPHNKIFENFTPIHKFITEEVERHKKDLDPNNPRDYIDAFLIEMEKVCKQQHGTHWSVLPFYVNKWAIYYSVHSAFLNSTKRLTWASPTAILLCAPWICSWLEQRQPQLQCSGLWSSSSNTLMFRVGGELDLTLC